MHATTSVQALRGHVTGFNLSPKGVPEGILLLLADGGGPVQVNFDPELAGRVTAVVAEGQAVTVDATAADVHAEAVHPVFRLVRLGDAGQPLLVAEGSPEPDVSVKGKVVRLNHALRGEVNGGILDSGEFVHLRPHGVRAIGGLAVGQTLEARGEVRAGWSGGHRVVEARTANGVEIGKPPHKPPQGPPHQPHGPKHAPGPKHKTDR